MAAPAQHPASAPAAAAAGPSGPAASRPVPPTTPLPPSFKYGAPLYGVAWPEGSTFYVCGGGGSTSSGIKNRLVVAECINGGLTDQTGEVSFGQDCPMRLAASPDGKSLVVAMASGGIKLLDVCRDGPAPTVALATGDTHKRASAIRGEVKCMAFTRAGTHLALGCTYGGLTVLAWPSLDVVFELSGESRLADGVRDVDLGHGPLGRLVAVVLDDGSAELWDWRAGERVCRAGPAKGAFKSSKVLLLGGPNHTASLMLPSDLEGVQFTKLRFCPPAAASGPPPGGSSSSSNGAGEGAGASGAHESRQEGGEASVSPLCALMNSRAGSHLVHWSLSPGTQMLALGRYRKLEDAPGASLDLSRDGRFIGVGTAEGSAMVLDAATLATIRCLPNAHMVFSTGMCFSPQASHALSISADASAVAIPTSPAPRGKAGVRRVLAWLLATLALLAAVLGLALYAAAQHGGRLQLLGLDVDLRPLLEGLGGRVQLAMQRGKATGSGSREAQGGARWGHAEL